MSIGYYLDKVLINPGDNRPDIQPRTYFFVYIIVSTLLIIRIIMCVVPAVLNLEKLK